MGPATYRTVVVIKWLLLAFLVVNAIPLLLLGAVLLAGWVR